ncbi:MAG: PD-(D/E)XK nuclease family protein [Nanoarchaeota archaeon]
MDFVWSASRIEDLEECELRHFFLYHSGIPKKDLLTFGHFVAGNVVHSFLERFYGPDRKPRSRYKSSESMGGALKGLWFHSIKSGYYRGKKIEWADEERRGDKEKFKFARWLERLGRTMYDPIMEEEGPVFPEFSFGKGKNCKKEPIRIVHDGHYHLFSGKIDQIRRGLIIRDFKSSASNPGDVILNNDISLTIYALAFCTFAHSDEVFRREVGVSDEEALRWGGNPTFIDENVRMEWYSLGSRRIFTASRSDAHFATLLEKVDGLEKQVQESLRSGHFEARVAKHCTECAAKKYCNTYLSSPTPRKMDVQLEINYTPMKEITAPKPKVRNQTPRFNFGRE